MKKINIFSLIVVLGFLFSIVPIFANDNNNEENNGCKIIKEENGCYLYQDKNGNTAWICDNDEGITTFDIPCPLDCWNFD